MERKAIYVGFTAPPSIDDVRESAELIIDELPEGLHKRTGKLGVIVEDFPDAFIEQEMELETPFDLLGCYQSAGPAAIGHLGSAKTRQDTLYLYRRPILDYWAEHEETLGHIVRHVLIHEFGHHFGLSDDDMHALEDMA